MKIRNTMLITAAIGCLASILYNFLIPEFDIIIAAPIVYFPIVYLAIVCYLKFCGVKDAVWIATVIDSPIWISLLICAVDIVLGTTSFIEYAIRSIPFAVTASVVILEYQLHKIKKH